MKKIIAFLLLICVFSLSVNATVSMEYPAEDLDVPLEKDKFVYTSANVTELNIEAKSAILMDTATGEILYENNSDEKMAPASITKVMTLLLVMEAIESGKISYNTKIAASEHAASMGGSQIWLKVGEEMTVDELLKASVIASANDAAVALAEAVSGSEESFVMQMNKKAEEMGLSCTHFENCTGLDSDNHYSSAHDIAVMSCRLLKHNDIRKYSTVWQDSLRGGKSELVNTNKLVRYYEGCTGLKTGTTSKAGCCLSASAKKENMELVAVVMGAENSKKRFETAKKLLNYGFANFVFKEISADIADDALVAVKKGVKNSVRVSAKEKIGLLLNSSGDKISQKVEINPEITAPIYKGDKVGTVRIFCGNEQVGVIDLVAKDNVKKLNVILTLGILLKNLVCL